MQRDAKLQIRVLVINRTVWEYCRLSVFSVCGSSIYFTLSALANYQRNNNNGNLHSKHYIRRSTNTCERVPLVCLFTASLVPVRHMGAHRFPLFHYYDADNVLASCSTVAKHCCFSI